jgi:hypothetical protein
MKLERTTPQHLPDEDIVAESDHQDEYAAAFLYCTPSDVHYLFTVGQDDSEAWYLVYGADEEDPLLFVTIRELLRTQQG